MRLSLRGWFTGAALLVLGLTLGMVNTGCQKLLDILPEGLTSEEIVRGLKVALDTASRDASGLASQAGGFLLNEMIKINLPPEIDNVVKGVTEYGKRGTPTRNAAMDFAMSVLAPAVNQYSGKLVELFNKSAEEASKTAFPEFKKAVEGMTISDGLSILQGGDSAATIFMKKATREGLYKSFNPIVDRAVQSLGVIDEYNAFAEKYNTYVGKTGLASAFTEATGYRFPDSFSTDVPGYVTDRALHGLYYLMYQEEKKIRDDPKQYASDILHKVFGSVEAKVRR